MIGERRFLKELADRVQMAVGEGRSSPTIASIDLAMSAVYYASIRREEGEKVLPNLLLVQKDDLARMASTIPVLQFSERERLTPESLRKRCLAFDRASTTFLALHEQDHIQIVGIAFWGWGGGNADLSPMRKCPGVRFEAHDSGTVSVHLGAIPLGLFRDGSFYAARQNVFHNPLFRDCMRETFLGVRSGDNAINSFGAGLQFLVQRAMSFGLGGTIIILADRKNVKSEECFEAGQEVSFQLPKNSEGHVPKGWILEVFDTEFRQTSMAKLRETRQTYLKSIAQLSCIDGALILGPDLEPIRMGAKLRSPTPNGVVYLGGEKDQHVNSSLGGVGTRHTSALGFVSFVERSIAIAISSDGPVSIFGWADGRLSWWKNAVDP